jgi:PAS domain-containing protein
VTEEHNNKIKLENLNRQLLEKQYSLEEQNSIIEELNAQLEEENKRISGRKRYCRQSLILSVQALLWVDRQAWIIFINKAWKELFNYLDFGQSCDACENFYINDDTCGNTEIFLQNMLQGWETVRRRLPNC